MKKKNQKGFIMWPIIVIAAVAVLVILIGTGYIVYKQYFTATSETQTVTGRIYTNNKYGFTIKHPSALYLRSAINNDILIISFQSSANQFPIWMYVGGKDDQSITKAINPTASDTHTVKKDSVKIGDISWNTIEEKDTPVIGLSLPISSYAVYATKGDYTYILRCIDCDSEVFGAAGAQMKAVFDKMLTTFQFTK
jgi:hypothetical protein